MLTENARAAVTIPSPIYSSRPWLCLVAWLAMSAPAAASATVTCDIDDKLVTFAMQAITGRSGPITHVQGGTIEIKPAANVKLVPPQLTFDRTHIVQQWLLDRDLRLQIEIDNAEAKQSINLVILARLNRKTEKYAGQYVLKIAIAGKTKELKGRIKDCEAG
ncbi:MAG: hypothetical protein HY244_15410 [Rhizobiales bacterium]|nr:hypothetical protein [Hyphomicrobiales bacterium]